MRRRQRQPTHLLSWPYSWRIFVFTCSMLQCTSMCFFGVFVTDVRLICVGVPIVRVRKDSVYYASIRGTTGFAQSCFCDHWNVFSASLNQVNKKLEKVELELENQSFDASTNPPSHCRSQRELLKWYIVLRVFEW